MAMGEWFSHFDPFREMARLQRDMNELFDMRRWWPEWGRAREFPPMNVATVGDEIHVTAELPGLSLDAIDLSITGDTLTLKGERKPDECREQYTYHRMERTSGTFMRTIRLPDRIDPDKAEARYVNGILTVRIPKAEETKPRKISVQAT